jgi:hypothetical protein
VAEFVQSKTTQAFQFELKAGDQKATDDLNQILGAAKTAVYNDPKEFDSRYKHLTDTIDLSHLPAAEKEVMKKNAFNAMLGVEYRKLSEEAATGQLPVGPADGSDVVAPGMPGYARGLLNTIAKGESSGSYNVITGGEHFTSYADHPRQYVEQPDGKFSSAAGRYQITASTSPL